MMKKGIISIIYSSIYGMLYILFFTSLSITSCDSNSGTINVDNNLILGCWQAKSENSKEITLVPCSRKLEPSRYRFTIIIENDKNDQYLSLSPNDGHVFKSCNIIINNDSLTIEYPNETKTYTIVSFENNELILKK